MPPFEWPKATALQVRRAAVCLCLRRVPHPVPEKLTREDAYGGGGEWKREMESGSFDGRADVVFGKRGAPFRTFHGEWEVLMGQNEAVNWLRSSKDRLVARRYPAEWVFAGGAVEKDETPGDAAFRELQEEFLVSAPESSMATPPLPPAPPPHSRATSACLTPGAMLRLLSVRQTRPIRARTDIMYNYVATASENSWLASLDTDSINAQLADRRARHAEMIETGEFWALEKKVKMMVSPEVRQVRWVGLREAVIMLFTSMNDVTLCVDDWQGEEFVRLGVTRRDPMFLTMTLLLDVESFPSEQSLLRYTDKINPDSELERVQWLYEGMPQHELDAAIDVRRIQQTGESQQGKPRYRKGGESITAEDLAVRRAERIAHDNAESAAVVHTRLPSQL